VALQVAFPDCAFRYCLCPLVVSVVSRMKPPKLYLDSTLYKTSGSDEMRAVSDAVLARCDEGDFQLCVSPVVLLELEAAGHGPDCIEEHLGGASVLPVTESVLRLREAYLQAGTVERASVGAAMHVAVATAAGCKGMSTWRFDEILRHDRLPQYNALNEAWGFAHLPIHSPLAMLKDVPERAVVLLPTTDGTVAAAVEGMSLEQEMAFWKQKTDELLERQKQRKKELKKAEKADAKPQKAGAK
jgi:hypothetical protein